MIKLPKLPKLGGRERLLAIGAAAVLSFLLIDRLLLVSWWEKMGRMRREIHEMEETLVKQDRLLGRKGEIEAEIQRYKSYIPPGEEKDLHTATLLKEIELLAKQARVTLEEVKPLSRPDADLYQVHAFGVTCTSALPEWVRFLHSVESSSSLYEIEKATVEMKEDKENPGLLQGYLLLTAISMRKPAD